MVYSIILREKVVTEVALCGASRNHWWGGVGVVWCRLCKQLTVANQHTAFPKLRGLLLHRVYYEVFPTSDEFDRLYDLYSMIYDVIFHVI